MDDSHPLKRLSLVAAAAVLLGNIAYLDYVHISGDKGKLVSAPIVQNSANSNGTSAKSTDNKCPGSCLTAIQDATAAAKTDVSPTLSQSARPVATKESFITIGNGSFNSEYDWGDVPGAQVTIDGSVYGKINKAVFEATVNTPSGGNQDVQLRLYNDTDKRPVWNSDLFFSNGSSARFLVSSPITIESGAKLYKVQMKTQFKTNANLDLARIHIVSG